MTPTIIKINPSIKKYPIFCDEPFVRSLSFSQWIFIAFASIKMPRNDEIRLDRLNPIKIEILAKIFIFVIRLKTIQRDKFMIKFIVFIERALAITFSFGLIGKVNVWYKVFPSLDRDEFIPMSFPDAKNLKAKDPKIINKYISLFFKFTSFINSKTPLDPKPHTIVSIIIDDRTGKR